MRYILFLIILHEATLLFYSLTIYGKKFMLLLAKEFERVLKQKAK